MQDSSLNSNKMESGKANHRTHHTRFFEKLYGNLEKSSDKKEEVVTRSYNYPSEVRQEILNSPSESSASSSEIFASEIIASRCSSDQNSFQHGEGDNKTNPFRNSLFPSSHEVGLNFPATILPSHFGALRLPMGFSNDPHNHFAAFRKSTFGSCSPTV